MRKSSKTNRTYGWKRDLPDHRDYRFAAVMKSVALPAKVDLSPYFPSIWDQGSIGSCTAQALAAQYQFDEIKQKQNKWRPSRLFIYYNERLLEGTVNSDAGAEIRDGIKAMVRWGLCSEDLWKYIEGNVFKKPSVRSYDQGKSNTIGEYYRLNQNLNEIQTCLASGYPFVFGIAVYESFESDEVARTGMVPMPGLQEQLLGGHAIVGVGYDSVKKLIKCRNSWGLWGDKGYFYLPESYVLSSDLADDFWTFKRAVMR